MCAMHTIWWLCIWINRSSLSLCMCVCLSHANAFKAHPHTRNHRIDKPCECVCIHVFICANENGVFTKQSKTAHFMLSLRVWVISRSRSLCHGWIYLCIICFNAMRWDIYRAYGANPGTRIVLELSKSNVIKSYYIEMKSDHTEDVWAAKCAFRIANCDMWKCEAKSKVAWKNTSAIYLYII